MLKYSKFLFILFVIFIYKDSLYSNGFDESTKTIIESKEFKNAMNLFNEKKYAEALKYFNNFFETESDNAQINFYIGRCATELKLYDEAIAAFERVLISDANHIRSKVELGRIYFEQQDYEQARDQFNEVLKFNVPENVKLQIQKYIDAINGATKEHSFQGALIFGFAYDSNVKNDIGNIYYNAGVFTNLQGRSEEGGKSSSEVLSIVHRYAPYKMDYSWQSSLLLYNQNYNKVEDSDVFYTQLSSSFIQRFGQSEFSIGPSFDRLIYDYKKLSTSLGVISKFSTLIQNDLLFEEVVSWKKQDYIETNDAMDAHIFESNTKLKKIFQEINTISVSLSLGKTNNINDGRTDVNQNTNGYKLEFGTVLHGFNIDVYFGRKWTRYKDEDVLYEMKRDDLSTSYGVTLGYPLSKQWNLSFGANDIKNASNFASSNYEKNTYNLNLMRVF